MDKKLRKEITITALILLPLLIIFIILDLETAIGRVLVLPIAIIVTGLFIFLWLVAPFLMIAETWKVYRPIRSSWLETVREHMKIDNSFFWAIVYLISTTILIGYSLVVNDSIPLIFDLWIYVFKGVSF